MLHIMFIIPLGTATCTIRSSRVQSLPNKRIAFSVISGMAIPLLPIGVLQIRLMLTYAYSTVFSVIGRKDAPGTPHQGVDQNGDRDSHR